MGKFFNMDNKFFQFMSRVADLIILNLLCIVCCLPIITIGASISSMYYVTLKMVRDEESYIVKGYFHAFRQNFKQSIPITLIMVISGAVLAMDFSIVRNSLQGTMSSVLHVIFMMMAVFYLLIFIYIHPLLAKFYNTVKNTFTNALLMGIRHLPYTALMILITAAPIILLLLIPSAEMQSMFLLFLILLGGATVAYCKSFFLVKIFDNYIPAEPEEAETDTFAASQTEAPVPFSFAEKFGSQSQASVPSDGTETPEIQEIPDDAETADASDAAGEAEAAEVTEGKDNVEVPDPSGSAEQRTDDAPDKGAQE